MLKNTVVKPESFACVAESLGDGDKGPYNMQADDDKARYASEMQARADELQARADELQAHADETLAHADELESCPSPK